MEPERVTEIGFAVTCDSSACCVSCPKCNTQVEYQDKLPSGVANLNLK
jgi:hypothetical protein